MFLELFLGNRGRAVAEAAEDPAKDRQRELGAALFSRVMEAVRENPHMGGKRSLIVSKWENKAGSYSVIVTLKKPGWSGCMMQFNMRLTGLEWLYGPDGPTEEAPLDDFERMADKACEHVRSFT